MGNGESLLKRADSVGAAAAADDVRRALRAFLIGQALTEAQRSSLKLGRSWVEWSLRRKQADSPVAYAKTGFAQPDLPPSSPPAALLVARNDLERVVSCLKALEEDAEADREAVEVALQLFKDLNRTALREFRRLAASARPSRAT